VVDLNSDHKLSQGEVREVLKAQLPINYVLFEEQLPSLFRNWDADGDFASTEPLQRTEPVEELVVGC